MKLFFVIFFAIIILLHIYICVRAYQALEYMPTARIPVIICIVAFTTIFILNQTGLLSILGFDVVRIITLFSSFWIFALIAIFFSLLLIDFVRALNYFFDFYPLILKTNYIFFKFIIMPLTIAAIVFWYILGHLNIITPQKTELDIYLNKPQIIENTRIEDSLKIVLVSDLHIGYLVNKKKLRQYVDSINAQKPDIVFIAGDLINDAIEPVMQQKMHEELMDIKSRLGVYLVLGNHDILGGDKDIAVEYFKKSGLIVLEDSVAFVDNRFYVAGRKDRMEDRITTEELVRGIDASKPIILLDHQPFNLDASVAVGVDLHLSGHTHDGQLFPFNLITKAVYELSAGYKLKGNTHIYVTSGIGIWGPPVRFGTKSEFVVINMKW